MTIRLYCVCIMYICFRRKVGNALVTYPGAVFPLHMSSHPTEGGHQHPYQLHTLSQTPVAGVRSAHSLSTDGTEVKLNNYKK